MLRRRPTDPRLRQLHKAKKKLRRIDGAALAVTTVERVEASMERAIEDLERLRIAIAEIDPSRATAELKSELRRYPTPSAPDTPHIAAFRRRHYSAHELANRAETLNSGIERTLIDVETMVAHALAGEIASGGENGEAINRRVVGRRQPQAGQAVEEEAEASVQGHRIIPR